MNRAHWQTVVLQETDSTMLHARRLIESGQIKFPCLIRAELQSEGRGRQGRAWLSEQGGFYATFVFEVAASPEKLAGFSLAVGSVISEVLFSHGVNVALKWPNDLLANDGRKLGGIMIETITRGVSTLILVGIGVNFDNPIDTAMMASVRVLGAKHLTIDRWSDDLSQALENGVQRFLQDGLEDFLPSWNPRDYLFGKQIAIDCSGQVLRGIAQGVTISGALRLKSDRGIEEIWSGHITAIED